MSVSLAVKDHLKLFVKAVIAWLFPFGTFATRLESQYSERHSFFCF
jgi:hypothetical protein